MKCWMYAACDEHKETMTVMVDYGFRSVLYLGAYDCAIRKFLHKHSGCCMRFFDATSVHADSIVSNEWNRIEPEACQACQQRQIVMIGAVEREIERPFDHQRLEHIK